MTTELIQFKTEMMESFQADMEIRTWGDFARRFLLGNGNSPNTTRTYLTACKQFYEFTGRLHPMQAGKDPAWIEQFYDQLPPDLDTRAARVAGLKYMYRRICEKYGMYPNPFDKMSDALKAKLKRTKKDESERGALTEAEYTGLLRMLKNEVSLKAIQSYALVRFAVTSGMRAAELSGLRWENISDIDGEHRATFIGKGNKLRTIQLEKQAVAAIRRSFRMRWGRKPSPGDKVFHGLPTGPGLTPGMSSGGIYYRVQTIITEAKATGIIRANLHVSPHTFRHTCATRLLAAGVDIRTVQQHLGHSNLATTMVYLDERQDLTGAWTQIHGDEV